MRCIFPERGVEVDGEDTLSQDTLRHVASELLATLLSLLGHEDPQLTASKFKASLVEPTKHADKAKVTRDVTLLDRWTAMQLSVLYVNLVAAAVAPDADSARICAHTLRRIE